MDKKFLILKELRLLKVLMNLGNKIIGLQQMDYIYKQTENILTNEGLKAVQADYALEQQYMEDLKKSDWDTQNQNAFLLRSRLQSSDIIYE